MVKKLYKKLTQEQKERGVVFSSCLSVERIEQEQQGDTIHEVFGFSREDEKKIERLKDDKFFNKSHFNYNIIRRG